MTNSSCGYNWGGNVLSDYFVQLMMMDYDISEPDLVESGRLYFMEHLAECGVDPRHIGFFDFEVKNKNKNNDNFKIKPNDIVSAMWICGFFPDNCNLLFEENKTIFDGKIFKFNKKTKSLTWELKK